MMQAGSPRFLELLVRRATVRRATRVSLIVGTLLIAINQGHLFLAGHWPPLWQIVATYLVPYIVSSYSTAAMLRDIATADSGIVG